MFFIVLLTVVSASISVYSLAKMFYLMESHNKDGIVNNPSEDEVYYTKIGRHYFVFFIALLVFMLTTSVMMAS